MLVRERRDLDDLRASDAIFARGAEKASKTRARMNSPPWGSPGRGAFFSFHLAPFAAAHPHRALGRTPRLMPCAPELVPETRALDMQESCVSRVLYKILAFSCPRPRAPARPHTAVVFLEGRSSDPVGGAMTAPGGCHSSERGAQRRRRDRATGRRISGSAQVPDPYRCAHTEASAPGARLH